MSTYRYVHALEIYLVCVQFIIAHDVMQNKLNLRNKLLYITEDVLESDVRIWMDTEKHGFLDAGQTSGY